MAAWTQDEERRLIDRRSEVPPASYADIAEELGRSFSSVEKKWNAVRRDRSKAGLQRIKEAALHPPIDTNDKDRIRQLELDNARLRQQITWAQHGKSDNRTGGVLTIRESDIHHGDEGHLFSCHASCWAKIIEVIKQYEPKRIQYVGLDDYIAGRGIFKEQDLSMAVSDPELQLFVAAVKFHRCMLLIRSVTNAPIDVLAIRGNHDFVGKVSVAAGLLETIKGFCTDIPDIKFVMNWDVAIINLAAEGTYNALFTHGYGHSQISPNSPKFISAVKDMLLQMSSNKEFTPDQAIRRVISGHTHWLSISMERSLGLYFDTTGGFQRQQRVQLGFNQRPVGMILYVSPDGMADEILNPIEIKPDADTFDREIADPELNEHNRNDCSEALIEYRSTKRERGELSDGSKFGMITQGRY